LIDLLEADEVFTAGQFRERAIAVLGDLRHRGKLPVIAAGTGLYLRALLEGLADAPTRSEELRARLRAREKRAGPGSLHRLLARVDSEAAARIASRDTQKIIRAIEMRVLAGKSVGEIHRGGRAPLQGYAITKIGLLPPRAELYARIDARVESMMKAGWPSEVRGLVDRGIPADAKPFQFIGYSAIREAIKAGKNPGAAVPSIQLATRRFAKRQITWFRKEPGVHWLAGFGDNPEITLAALSLLRSVPAEA